MASYCNGMNASWYTGCSDRARRSSLAEENGVSPINIHDAPEHTAEAVWHVMPDGAERRWLAERFGPFGE